MVLLDNELFIKTTLALVIGTLAAIVYSLRYLVVMERRMGRIERHIEYLAKKVLAEEITIERAVKKRK